MVYQVKLDLFEGPLDLLLKLLKENEVDIYDISIATITDQYFDYLNMMKELNLEVAGEYLVMAATLTYIKSRAIAPSSEADESEGDEDDLASISSREELIARLIEYKKYKEASRALEALEARQSEVFTRRPDRSAPLAPDDALAHVGALELLDSLRGVIERLDEKERRLTVTLDEISVSAKINELTEALEDLGQIFFTDLFAASSSKAEIVATFLALLELIRLRLVRARQSGSRSASTIVIEKIEYDRSQPHSDEVKEDD